ncbi:MAG: LysR family transcriptional regulator [Planctomycetota bacterium]
MFEGLEALAALVEHGTMTRAATHLRLTQSAVSKRIRALEASLGARVVEPAGRGVVVTPAGIRLLDRAAPLLAGLKAALDDRDGQGTEDGTLVVGVSESILASWGPPALAAVRAHMPGLDVRTHAHRSPVVVDGVLAGEFALGLVAGGADRAAGLVVHELREEDMVVVPSGLQPLVVRRGSELSVVGIEPASATGRALTRRLRLLERTAAVRLQVTQTLQSYACIVQLARCGFGHGLVPEGIALAMGVPPQAFARLPKPGLRRPIALVGRAKTFERPVVVRFHARLAESLRSPARSGRR